MKILGKLSVFIIITAVLALGAAFPSSAASVKRPIGYIKTSGVNIRSGAGTGYSVVLSAKKNTKVKLYSGKKYNTYWYKIRISGKKGYVHKKYLKFPRNQLFISPTATVYVGYKAKYSTLFNSTGKTVKWTSSRKNIATVDQKGVITPRKAGKTAIVVKAGKVKYKSIVTVKNAAVKLSSTEVNMLTEDKLTLKASCKKAVSWSSSDSSVVSVNGGALTAGNKVGTAVITAKSRSGSAKCAVTVKQRVISLKADKTTAYVGCRVQLKPSGGAHAYTYSSSNTKVFTVNSSGIATAVAKGEATVTCKSGNLTAKLKLKAKSGSAVNISHKEGEVKAGMTLYVKSTTKSVTWKSSNTSVATVNGGFVTAHKKGTVLITASTSKGASDCLVSVKAAEPVRFTYTSENSVLKDSTVTFYAITDTSRTSVKFKITPESGSATSFKATSKTTSDGRIIWKADKKLSTAGKYAISAYSKTSSTSWATSDGGTATVFVNSNSSRTATTLSEKRASTALLRDIASFEGYVPNVSPDELVADSPTVGYGRVVYAGTSFYNGMTKDEAFAYLVKTVNDSGYNSRVNKILTENKIYCNQQQFDALVDFSYNLGVYAITNHEELIGTLQNTYGKESYKNTGYISSLGTVLRSEASADSSSVKNLSAGVYVTVQETSGSWYKVLLSDKKTTGYIKKSQITLRTTDTSKRNLNNVTPTAFKVFLNYHHASSTCYKGLLYRRVDELEMFLYNDYTCNGKSNKYGITYTCPSNKSFTFG